MAAIRPPSIDAMEMLELELVDPLPAPPVPAIKLGNSFITLITAKNRNGEIRGQIRVRTLNAASFF